MPNESPEPERVSRPGCTWPAAAAVIAIFGLATILFLYIFHESIHLPGTLSRELSDAAAKMQNLFGTEVKVDSRSVTLESREILELATVQHRIVCVTKYTTKWAGSTATIIIRGVYTAKAGFALEGGATFLLDEHGQVRDDSVPAAKVLSISTEEQKIFFDAQGVLKSLEAKDYEEAFRQNRAQAEREAEQMGLREEARTRLKERLGDMLPGRLQPRPKPAPE